MPAHYANAATLLLSCCLFLPFTTPAQAFTWWDDSREMAITQSRAELIRQVRQYKGLSQLQYVNRVINNAARQQEEDTDIWKGFDRLTREGYGDCEDFAIAKYQILRDADMPADRLDFLAARDTLTPTYHAVLRYRMDDGSYLILDNLTTLILPQAQRTDLTPIVAFDETHSTLWQDHRFVSIAPSRIRLGSRLLSERMANLMRY